MSLRSITTLLQNQIKNKLINVEQDIEWTKLSIDTDEKIATFISTFFTALHNKPITMGSTQLQLNRAQLSVSKNTNTLTLYMIPILITKKFYDTLRQ
jgi:hypothetical protein